ncbi:MAG TPA: hypothetical protein VKF38_00920, partial [Anaerolineaceae bacterium]|nr:hypothetical protein [Anaerolineaceae bacterium]
STSFYGYRVLFWPAQPIGGALQNRRLALQKMSLAFWTKELSVSYQQPAVRQGRLRVSAHFQPFVGALIHPFVQMLMG